MNRGLWWSCVWIGVCALCCAGQAQAEPNTRLSVVSVDYGEPSEHDVQAVYDSVESALKQNWNSAVIGSDEARAVWVTAVDDAALEALDKAALRGHRLFYRRSPSAAIPTLEQVVDSSDRLLGHVSADPVRAEMLFQSHLLLWWALKKAGESNRLDGLMARTVERFPAALVNTTQMPPDVVEAFEKARDDLNNHGVALRINLRSQGSEPCHIALNGHTHGDGRVAGLSVRAGRTYYATGRCKDRMLPPRRIVVTQSREVELDMLLVNDVAWSGHHVVVHAPAGWDAVSELTEVGVAVGMLLDTSTTVLAGVQIIDTEPVLQLDRIDVAQRRRTCSIRTKLSTETDGYTTAVRALLACTSVAAKEAAQDSPHPPPGDETQEWLWSWITSGLMVTSLSTALMLELAAADVQHDLDGCVARSDCRGSEKVDGLRGELSDILVTRNALYIGSGVFAALAVALFFVETPHADNLSMTGVEVAPWLNHSGAGLDAAVRW